MKKSSRNRWQREQSELRRARHNAAAAKEFARRWHEIRAKLGDGCMDDELQDTYMRMTRIYDGSRDFAAQFVAEFSKVRKALRYSDGLASDLPLKIDKEDALAEKTE